MFSTYRLSTLYIKKLMNQSWEPFDQNLGKREFSLKNWPRQFWVLTIPQLYSKYMCIYYITKRTNKPILQKCSDKKMDVRKDWQIQIHRVQYLAFNIFLCRFSIISYNMLIITRISNEVTYELTIYAILCRNLTIFYQQELTSFFKCRKNSK